MSGRVYAAEDQWSAVLDRGGRVDFFGSALLLAPQRRFGDIESVRRYVAAVQAMEYVSVDFPGSPPIRVRERSGQTRAHYEPQTGTIAVPLQSQWAARESVVLHEIAHHLDCHRSGNRSTGGRHWHGIGFRQTLCRLVDQVLGSEAALLLRAGYEAAGLKTVPQP